MVKRTENFNFIARNLGILLLKVAEDGMVTILEFLALKEKTFKPNLIAPFIVT